MMTDKKDEALKLAQGYMDGTLMTDHLTGYERKRYVMEAIREALAEQPAQGCDYCNHPLYAGTSCKNCGRVTEQPAQQQACHSKTGESEAQSNLTPTGEAQAQQQEPTVEDNSQNWRGMDGTTAYWLIQRHADGWADIGKMMGEWLEANQTQPAQQQEPVAWQILNGVCHAGIRSTEDMAKEAAAGMQKTHDLGGSLAAFHVRPLYTSPPASKPWVGLTDEEELKLAQDSMGKSRHWLVAQVGAKLREKNA